MPNLSATLATLRAMSKSEREKGEYFEKLCVAFLRQDPGMQQEFGRVWLFKDWAAEQGVARNDTGIDVVAEVREGGFCAVQCKFFAATHAIQKIDLDSFYTASGRHGFTARLIVDTTTVAWGKNAEDALVDQQVKPRRIALDRLDLAVDWTGFIAHGKAVATARKQPREHQQEALAAVRSGLALKDRGKVLMACGTGKTYTGLMFAEALAGAGGSVLFLVPSLALMSQTIREWSIDATVPLRSRAVCSDTQVGRRRSTRDDVAEFSSQDLDVAPTTDAGRLAASLRDEAPERLTAVFATYQSVHVIAEAQRLGLPEFDLIVCDEAHRTTGVVFSDEQGASSNFVMVHDQTFLQGRKRIYMTATPRIFGDAAKTKAGEASVELCSMDDPAIFGETLFERGFAWAVEKGLLADYKVVVLAVDEAMVSASLQKRLASGDNELKLDDATKIIGCYKALSKAGLGADLGGDAKPMQRGLAFCKDIASSKLIRDQFAAVIGDFVASDEGRVEEAGTAVLSCDLRHVDGTFAATARTELLDWLKATPDGEHCRILTNARCLSEGVDVPALDAILFMHPRKSQIDVVQAVGRVMRVAPGKARGYVILPVGIPAGVAAEDALNENERYRVVWQVLNALRSHDERLDATINKIGLGENVSSRIEVIAVSDKLPAVRSESTGEGIGYSAARDPAEEGSGARPQGPVQAAFVFDEVSKAIMAKIVKKCGRADFFEKWAGDIATIAKTHITRITTIVVRKDSPEREAFLEFLAEMRRNLNDSITEADAVEMLAQHIITRPVFEALFEGHAFAQSNPVSRAMEAVLTRLDEHTLGKEAATLDKFYDSVRRRAAGTESGAAKQRMVTELYEKFFQTAFPKTTERLGIVYTPDPIIDFILHSVDDVLRDEFGQSLGSEGVHILDAFAGTGTFIVRLLRSGLLSREQIVAKYGTELHACEIVLLAYYIASVNIEATYLDVVGGDYRPFEGICLTDTFEASDDLLGLAHFGTNAERVRRQRQLPIQVIVGNPPYSVGQKGGNENNQNVSYPEIDTRISVTYAARSKAVLKRSLYDSYVRAIRWASDRIGTRGVIGFVTNAGFVESNSADGLRKCLVDEFSSVFVFHLRGNQRTSGETSRREGGQLFGAGSRAPIAISVLVKNPNATEHGIVKLYDVGDYLTREQKLSRLDELKSVSGLESRALWNKITPDRHGDWLRQRDDSFKKFLPIKSEDSVHGIFSSYSNGLKTNRDSWCFSFSEKTLSSNIKSMIAFYNSEREKFDAAFPTLDRKGRESKIDSFVSYDPSKISWSTGLKMELVKNREIKYIGEHVVKALSRPFTRQWVYFDRQLNERPSNILLLFPNRYASNKILLVSGCGKRGDFTSIITDTIPGYNVADIFNGSLCFPLSVYNPLISSTKTEAQAGSTLFPPSPQVEEPTDFKAITDAGLAHFKKAYLAETISKEDVFHYVYGLLHSPDYRRHYADTLRKELPRVPLVRTVESFRAFVQAGRNLGLLHLDFESQEGWPGVSVVAEPQLAATIDRVALYRVAQMKFAGKRPSVDRTTVIYNAHVTLAGIPLEAYEYVVNGKSAIEWVMEQQCVSTDKESSIVNDANDYANETMNDPEYPLKLLQSVITVSMRTLEIVRNLPPLDIMPLDVAVSETYGDASMADQEA